MYLEFNGFIIYINGQKILINGLTSQQVYTCSKSITETPEQ